ncbi:MAG TPA: hypothetical protein VFN97_27345 [Actinospica sp.]|nr:hypothetical protein [Actinospica sp.]
MSKDFDSTLSDAIDLAAGAAHTAGASAARSRGRERTVRKRIVVSATSFVLVAAGAGAAFGLTAHHGGGTPHVTAASPSATASASATAGPSPSGTPSASPSGSASTTGSPSAPPSRATATGQASASENWLTPTELIYDITMSWQAAGPTSCGTGSYELYALYPGGCSEHTLPHDPHPAVKMDTETFSAPSVPTGNGAWAGTTAAQEFYTYASAADAQAAYQYFTQQILGEDSQFAGSSDADTHLPVTSTTTETAHADGAMAIDDELRQSDGKPAQLNGNPSDASDRHYFLAVRGDLVEMVVVQGGPAVSDTSDDASYLQSVISALS